MTVTFDGRKYLVRGNHTRAELLALYARFCRKYGDCMTLHQWLVSRGKVYVTLPTRGRK